MGSRGCCVGCRGLKRGLFDVGCSVWHVGLCIVELGCRVQGFDVKRLNRGQWAGARGLKRGVFWCGRRTERVLY